MKVSILIIGDEILSGETMDTNSGFACELLNSNGLNVVRKLTVGDKAEEIKSGLDLLLGDSDLVISTGGLGPTKDDITMHAFADYFQSEIVFDEGIYHNLKERYAQRGKDLNKLNKSQAMVPLKAQVIQNPVGTAPVLWFHENGKVLVALPGVPHEMEFLMRNVVMERLKNEFIKEEIVHRTIHTVGIPESTLAEKIAEIDDAIEKASSPDVFYKLAYLPKLGMVKLRLTGIGKDREAIMKQLDDWKEQIKELAGDYIFGYDKDIFATYIGNLLRDSNTTLSTAESCTGGYLAHQITSVTGSADYYMGSIISYDNSVKINELGVKEKTLEEFGAVSEETLKEMLKGCLKKFKTTYVIATTGIAGPTGGIEGKPIGAVWIGVASKEGMVTKCYHFNRNRLENIHLFAITAMDMLRKYILDIKI